MKVPLLDLKAQYASIKDEVDAAVAEVFASQYFILGPRVEALEAAVADYCGCPAAVGVSSGTDALLMSLMAAGIGPGDEVITTPYSFFATAGSIVRAGATPVFVDIEPKTCNLDVDQVAARITPRTRALMPVHLYGQMADMAPLMALAEAQDLTVIEDGCQAIGAEYRGQRAGAIGDYGCFSFFPTKNLGGAGDGGIVVCKDAARAARLKLLRNHGSQNKVVHAAVGGNFRLDALQAVVVAAKLPHLDQWTAARQANAAAYERLFKGAGLTVDNGPVSTPTIVTDRHVFNQYVIRAQRRDELLAHLKTAGIGAAVYYAMPLHLQPCFADLGYQPGDLPEAERAARETLALPVYPELTETQLACVVDAIAAFYSRN